MELRLVRKEKDGVESGEKGKDGVETGEKGKRWS